MKNNGNENYWLHYARVNNIDPNSPESIKKWYKKNEIGLDRILNQFLPENRNKKILELGCGTGNILNYFINRGYTKVLGVDISEEQLSICKKYITDKVVHDDVFNFLSNSSQKFDLIILFDLIEHIDNNAVSKLLDLVFKSLNLGGEILIRTPNMSSIVGLHIRYDDYTHKIGFTEESIKQLLEKSNFKNIASYNSYLGNRRKICMRFLYRCIFKLHFLNTPNIMTANIMTTAKRINY